MAVPTNTAAAEGAQRTPTANSTTAEYKQGIQPVRTTNSGTTTTAERKQLPVPTAQPSPARFDAQKPRFATSNSPLNPRNESPFLAGRDAFGLRRGAIIRTHRDASSPGSYIPNPANRYTFRFLYNPETISFGNQSFEGVTPPNYQNPADNLVPLFVGKETVNFSLLLDRSQDVYEQGLASRGTLDDVEALYRVVNGDLGSRAGFLSLSAVEIHWGPSTQNGRPVPMFPCFITSIDVAHTQFTPRMCPMRTAVSISAVRLVGSEAAGAGLSSVGGS